MRLGHVNRSVKNMFTRYRLSLLPVFDQSPSPSLSSNNLSLSLSSNNLSIADVVYLQYYLAPCVIAFLSNVICAPLTHSWG